jgi:hypothetical protein
MTKISVKQKIAEVLMENTNGFLSIEQIASLSYKDAYMKETKKHLNGLIKRNITHAIAMLMEEGFLVIKDLEPCVNSKKISHKTVNGYKIADKEDSESIIINLKTKSERLEIAEQTKFDFESIINNNKYLLEN